MKSKYTFTKLAFSNLKWGLVISLLLLTIWFFSFFEEKSMVLPVVGNIGLEKQTILSFKDYNLFDNESSAMLEAKVPFLKKLLLTRPVFNIGFVTCLFIFFLSFSMYRFAKNVEKEIAFKEKTYILFYWISISCFIYFGINYLLNIWSNNYILELTDNKYRLNLNFETNLITAFMGYFFFVLSHSFKKGFLLQREQDLTV